MPYQHVAAPTKGYIANQPSTTMPREASPFMKGIYIKDGEIRSDFGHTNYPVPGNTKTNKLNGTIMRLEQFYLEDATSVMLCMTTTALYRYLKSTDTWDCISQGVEVDDAEAAWDAQSDVTSTADATIKLRDSKSAKHVIAAAFGTGIVSSEDDVQNADISAATNTHVAFWIRSDTTIASDVLRLRFSEQATGGIGASYADFTVPALTADTWTHVIILGTDKVAGSGTWPTDFNAIASVALVAQSDPGAITVYLDDIRTANGFTGDEDNRFSTTIMNDTFVLTNGIDQPFKVSNTLAVTELATTLNVGTITKSEIVLTLKDHLVLLNNTENGSAAPLRATWTNIGAVEDWVAGTSGFQDMVDEESHVVAAMSIGENAAVIYKERSVVLMQWVGGGTPFRFTPMLNGTGAVSKEGVVDLGGQHAIFGPDIVYTYSGGFEINILDDDIRQAMYDGYDSTYEKRVMVTYIEEDDELQIWLPSATSNNPKDVWCYNMVKKVWYRKERTMNAVGFFQRQNSLTIGDLTGTIGEQTWRIGDSLTKAGSPITLVGDSSGEVFQLDKTTSNNDGVAITSDYETPDFTLPTGKDFLDKFMRVSQLVVEAKGNAVTTYYSTDGGNSWSNAVAHTLDSIYKIYQFDFDVVCRRIRFRFYNDTVDSSFQLRYYGFEWKARSRRR